MPVYNTTIYCIYQALSEDEDDTGGTVKRITENRAGASAWNCLSKLPN